MTEPKLARYTMFVLDGFVEQKLCDDGAYVYASDAFAEIERLTYQNLDNLKVLGEVAIERDKASRAGIRMMEERDRLRMALERLTIEVSHAMSSGPGWYTKGEGGLRSHLTAEIQRASAEIAASPDTSR